MNRTVAITILTVSLLFFSVPLFAANHYVRAGATGANTGSSWTDAWSSFASVKWTRGDTYFVAGGVYNENVAVGAPLSVETWITLKKANGLDNSRDDGWAPAYASDVALINGTLSVNSGYVEINGVTGSATSGHGIMVRSAATSGSVVTLAPGISFVKLYHLDIQGAGYAGMTDYRGVYLNSIANKSKGIHFKHLYVHGVSTNGYTLGGIVGTSFSDYGLLFENNYQEETGGCTEPNQHGQGIQVGYSNTQAFWIIRNSVIKNARGSAYIAFLGYGENNQIRIYNNLFHSNNQELYTASPAVIWAHELSSINNMEIYNNTFYNVSRGRIAIYGSGSARLLKNNLFHTAYFNYTHQGVTSENNAYFACSGGGRYPYGVPSGEVGQQNETLDPLLSAGIDFSLVKSVRSADSGVNLSSVFADDFIGAVRSEPWSIGAYQYTDRSGIAPPFFLRIAQ